MTSLAAFVAAALFEIAGCFALYLRDDRHEQGILLIAVREPSPAQTGTARTARGRHAASRGASFPQEWA